MHYPMLHNIMSHFVPRPIRHISIHVDRKTQGERGNQLVVFSNENMYHLICIATCELSLLTVEGN